MRFWIIILSTLVLDQASKYMVETYMELGQSVPVINNLLNFTYVLNPGAAFGYFAYQTNLFIIITLLVIIFIVYYNYSLPSVFSIMRIGLALQLGGAVGNLIDRIRTGYVVDFFDISFFPPVFNIADMAIILGIFFFVYSLWGEGRHLVHDEKPDEGLFPRKNFKCSLIGYDTKETDNYLKRVNGDLEVFLMANKQLKEQMHKLYKDIKTQKEKLKEKEDLLRLTRETQEKMKEDNAKDIEKEKEEIGNSIKDTRKQNEEILDNHIKLKQERNQLIINKDNYNKITQLTDEASSILYHLASTLNDNVEMRSEARKKETENQYREALELKEKALILYKEALKENENLRKQLILITEELEKHEKNEKYLAGAIYAGEQACRKIEMTAQREAEAIREEAKTEAQRIIDNAVNYADLIFPRDKEEYKNMYRKIMENNNYFRSLLTEKMSVLETEEIFDADKT